MADDQDQANAGGEAGGSADEAAAAAKAAEDAKAAEAAKATEGKPADGDAKPQDGNGKDDAPIQYEAFTMPEGTEMDQDALAAFTPLAQEFKIPQEKAQELANIMAGGLKKQAEAHAKAWAEAMGKWRTDAEADPEIGGEKFKETEAHVSLAMKKLGTPKLEEILKITGTGNHVELIRIFSKVGKILSDDKIDFGGVLGEGSRDAADIMYPNQGKA